MERIAPILPVRDRHASASEWRLVGVDVSGPDGNVIRFGSPIGDR